MTAAEPRDIEAEAAALLPGAMRLAEIAANTRPSLREEFESAAAWGVFLAIRSYDPGRGVRLEALAFVAVKKRIASARLADRPIGYRAWAQRHEDPPRTTAFPLPPADRSPGPEAGVDSLDRADALLRRLPAGAREPLRMIAFGGMSKAEVAAELGVGPVEVSRRLRRARESLIDPSIRHVEGHATPGKAACRPGGYAGRVPVHRHDEPLPGLPDGESWCPDCLRVHRAALRHGEMTRARSDQNPRY